ncbi:catalase-related domain-containing protein [Paraburkholderia piptadeniae]|uniref:catalase-related domain-containing protein n=1 Tax=Paraburkholderia piptadeniae TaxID=1701573 RepID=UPI001F2BC398|nr:catalase-related domain-containing protein [Paraburkholderia piptadeniae]
MSHACGGVDDYQGVSDVEKEHIALAYQFELGKVTKPEIRARIVNEILANFDADLAATPLLIAPTLAAIDGINAEATIAGTPSIMFDGVVVRGDEQGAKTLAQSGDARHFVLEAFRHLMAIAALGAGKELLNAAHLPDKADGVSTRDDVDAALKPFVDAVGQHLVWSRKKSAESVLA